ncbi:unnamed protein product, partial [marine sediment metagenome]
MSKAFASAFKSQTVDGDVMLGPEMQAARQSASVENGEDDKPAVVALASGNLGLISFTEIPHRLTLEELNASYPAVIPGLAAHEV